MEMLELNTKLNKLTTIILSVHVDY